MIQTLFMHTEIDYTLFHGPNCSGKSRHGVCAFNQYTIALSIDQLLFASRPPWGIHSAGSVSLILFSIELIS